jgi:hypothetical protein
LSSLWRECKWMALWIDNMVKINLIFIKIKSIFYSEACKKFFLRSVNEEYRKYKCSKDKKCLITRTTRTQCQYCRYTRCIEVGMKLSGRLT